MPVSMLLNPMPCIMIHTKLQICFLNRLNLSYCFSVSGKIQRSEWVGGSMKAVGLDWGRNKNGGRRVI